MRAFFQILGALVLVAFALVGCSESRSGWLQGYIEGEFVYVASPSGGQLQKLFVQRGQHVSAGDPLFVLDVEPEKAAREEAHRRLLQAQSNLEDVKKGKRPTELAAVEAQLEEARAALNFSEQEFTRQEKLLRTGVSARQEADRARATRDGDRERVRQLESDLKTAQMGAREDQIEAAAANVRAMQAALDKAEWELSQKSQNAPQGALVFDTLYRQGEWVAAGRPVVSLLPPGNIKVRAFVPEREIATVRPGMTVRVKVDGITEEVPARVSYISPRAEYTPPVIYSSESRSKLVFMIEAVFDPEVGGRLHPGQPVDVRITE